MPSAEDIVQAASTLLGVQYRDWHPGDSIPMWLNDGYGSSDLYALRLHVSRVGVMGADLINYALQLNGIGPNGGTGTFSEWLVNAGGFDPYSPGQRGAIALRPYQNEQDNGSIALYLDEHRVIQSIPSEGVTDNYTDQQTYQWASQGYPRYGFTTYGLLWGVSY
jgi:hypothetical protein